MKALLGYKNYTKAKMMLFYKRTSITMAALVVNVAYTPV